MTALERWPSDGVPNNPGAWLMTTARRKGIDRLRRDARYRDKLARLEETTLTPTQPLVGGDDRLTLIFTCCHPALARDAQLALTLRSVAGLTTAEIARAFVVPEATVAQRIVRAKRKIVEAHIPFRVPAAEELTDRLGQVLTVLYLLFNEGYLSSAPDHVVRRDLAEEAEYLAATLATLMPDEPEVLGLLALMRLHLARAAARVDDRGRLVLLPDQDRSRWDREAINRASALVERAARMRRPGPYQVQAAIAAVHAEAATWQETDWPEALRLYDLLAAIDPSPVVALNRAIARSRVAGPASALNEIEPLAATLDRYHLFHATRAELLRECGRLDEAQAALDRAIALVSNPAERALLEERLLKGARGGPAEPGPAERRTS